MNTVTLQEPRSVTRLAFDKAISHSTTEGAREEFAAALQWYEMKWQAQEQERRRQAQAAATPPPSQVPSAVETDGIDSDKAQAKRDQRRQKRLAQAAAKKESAVLSAGDKAGESGDKPAVSSGSTNEPRPPAPSKPVGRDRSKRKR